MNPIEANAIMLLNLMFESGGEEFDNKWLQQSSDLTPDDINDAIYYLEDLGAVEVLRTLGTAPFRFYSVVLQSRGRFLYHELKTERIEQVQYEKLPPRPVNPIGSPFGFTDHDWEEVAINKEDNSTLFVVLGMQFESTIYDRDRFTTNIKSHCQKVVDLYNDKNPNHTIKLQFEPLGAGLGEHLFNDIARCIIGSDIAFFETSHLNPNVMLEMGVALTWGIRVIPIKEKNHEKPPSDVSGQTWVDYKNSGEQIADQHFYTRLLKTVERAIARKGSRGR